MHEWAHCLSKLSIAAAFWIIWIVSVEECSSWKKIWCKLIAALSYFECDSHTVHMFTQCHLSPPLTSKVKLSLFTHAHSSSLSLAARLHGCHINHSVTLTMAGLFPDSLYTQLLFVNSYPFNVSWAKYLVKWLKFIIYIQPWAGVFIFYIIVLPFTIFFRL